VNGNTVAAAELTPQLRGFKCPFGSLILGAPFCMRTLICSLLGLAGLTRLVLAAENPSARESFTLDATTFEHRGTRYLAWAQSIPDVRGPSLFLAKMDTPWSITGTQV
jgi:hypothetical protein